MKSGLLISILAVAFVLWTGEVCAGETIFVDAAGGGNFTSIQTAIDSAANGDEILVAPGTYYEAINFNGKAVRVRSTGGGRRSPLLTEPAIITSSSASVMKVATPFLRALPSPAATPTAAPTPMRSAAGCSLSTAAQW